MNILETRKTFSYRRERKLKPSANAAATSREPKDTVNLDTIPVANGRTQPKCRGAGTAAGALPVGQPQTPCRPPRTLPVSVRHDRLPCRSRGGGRRHRPSVTTRRKRETPAPRLGGAEQMLAPRAPRHVRKRSLCLFEALFTWLPVPRRGRFGARGPSPRWRRAAGRRQLRTGTAARGEQASERAR